MSSKQQNSASAATKPAPEVKNGFPIPKWAGKPPAGLHLDVMKEGKMIQKLMIDEKNCYFFGRNQDSCDFVIDHASCSRVHAALVWHKDLNRSFLVDLNSTHGTFIGSLRLEANKPQQVFIDSELKFGASTRTYIIREKPQNTKNHTSILNNSATSDNDDNDDSFTQTLTLPESELELDNLTEFNTAHNKRIAQLADISSTSTSLPSVPGIGPVKKKKKSVMFNEEEDIINPEDIDPTIGRFRNLVQTTVVIPRSKRPVQKSESSVAEKKMRTSYESKIEREFALYEDHEEYNTMGFKCLNSAPDVDSAGSSESAFLHQQSQHEALHGEAEHDDHKKRYAKESWPGRHPATNVPAATQGSPTHTKRLII